MEKNAIGLNPFKNSTIAIAQLFKNSALYVTNSFYVFQYFIIWIHTWCNLYNTKTPPLNPHSVSGHGSYQEHQDRAK